MSLFKELEQHSVVLQKAQNDDERVAALLEILNVHSKLSSTDSGAAVAQLGEIAERTGNVTYRAWYCFYDAVHLRHANLTEQSIEKFSEANDLFRRVNDQNGMARTSINAGIAYRTLGNYIEAMRQNSEALSIAERNADKMTMALALNNIGNAWMFMGDYPQALDALLKSMEIRQELNNEFGISASARNIGNLYFKQQKYPEALSMYRQALEICERIGDQSGAAASLYNIGLVYDQTGDYGESIRCYETVAGIFRERNDERNYAQSLSSLGLTKARLGKIAEAKEVLSEAISIFQRIKDPNGEASATHSSGVVSKLENDPMQAIAYFERSIHIAAGIGVKDQVQLNQIELAGLYEEIGDYRQALRYQKTAHEIEKEILGKQSMEQLTRLNFQHDNAQREAIHKATERILHNILPQAIAEKIKRGEEKIIQRFSDTSCLFADISGFTTWSAARDVEEVAETLNTIFNLFDELAIRYGAEKIKTIGDCYMCVAGLPEPCADHALRLARLALAMNKKISELWPDGEIKLRVGIHSGEVIAGVLGKNKYAYDLWGDTVNTASRMESNGEPGKVNVSEATWLLVKDHFNCLYRGEIAVKGKGNMRMHFLTGEK